MKKNKVVVFGLTFKLSVTIRMVNKDIKTKFITQKKLKGKGITQILLALFV